MLSWLQGLVTLIVRLLYLVTLNVKVNDNDLWSWRSWMYIIDRFKLEQFVHNLKIEILHADVFLKIFFVLIFIRESGWGYSYKISPSSCVWCFCAWVFPPGWSGQFVSWWRELSGHLWNSRPRRSTESKRRPRVDTYRVCLGRNCPQGTNRNKKRIFKTNTSQKRPQHFKILCTQLI